MLYELNHSQIQAMPQTRFLHQLIDDLWAQSTIMAIWLGGSLARGTADQDSDVDLRVAVPAEFFARDKLPAGTECLAPRIAGQLKLQFVADSVTHHLLLDDGFIYDMLVQTTSRPPTPERRLVLGCRDEQFGELLRGGEDPAPPPPKPADPGEVGNLIAEYWIGFSKHAKVLNRGLDLLACQGEQSLRSILFRLYHIAATGADCGPRPSIHSLSPATRAMQETMGEVALNEIGRPMQTRHQLMESADAVAREFSRVGRVLSQRMQFDYPEKVERAARNAWNRRKEPIRPDSSLPAHDLQ